MTRDRRMVALGLGVLAAFAWALTAGVSSAGAALAADDVRTVTTQVTVSPGSVHAEMVQCNSGERAISGGAIGSVQHPASEIVVSGPVDSTGDTGNTDDFDVPRAWYTAVANLTKGLVDPPFDVTWTFYALCSANSDALVQATTFAIPAWTSGFVPPSNSASTACPAGQRAIGGGDGTTGLFQETFQLMGNTFTGNPELQSTSPLDSTGSTANTDDGDVATSWFAQADNATGSPHTFKTFAICSATSTATIQASPVNAPDNDTSETVTCPDGQSALGGGIGTGSRLVDASGPGDASGQLSLANGGTPGSWFVAMNSTNANFKAFVLCEARTPPAGGGGGGGGGDGGGGGPGPGSTVTCHGLAATIVGSQGGETLRGTTGDDVIAALGGNDKVNGLAGNDVICGGVGSDSLKGGGGTDILLGQRGRDALNGGSGKRDRCIGGPAKDAETGSCETSKS